MRNVIQIVQERHTLVEELLSSVEVLVREPDFCRPHAHVLIGGVDLPDPRREPFEIPVPVHRHEVRVAGPVARRVEVLQPLQAARGARDGRRAEFDVEVFSQGFHLGYPGLGGGFGRDAGAAVFAAVGLVEAEGVFDCPAGVDQALDGFVEGSGVVAGGLVVPEHGDELQFGVDALDGVCLVVVVPCQAGFGPVPGAVVGGIFALDVAEAALGGCWRYWCFCEERWDPEGPCGGEEKGGRPHDCEFAMFVNAESVQRQTTACPWKTYSRAKTIDIIGIR